MIDLVVLHLRRHWRINLAVLLCLTLASALLASLSNYTEAMATRELNQSLEEALPTERNLLITGNRYTFDDELYQQLQGMLGEIQNDWLVIRHVTLPADPQPLLEEEDQKQTVAFLDVHSFNLLAENVRVVEGRLPAPVRLREAEDTWRPPPIEAVIGRHPAEQSGYNIGDRITASKTYHRLDIVGIVESLDPYDDIWGEDLSAFESLTETGDLNADATVLPLIIDRYSMQSNYPEQPIFWHEVSWRVTLNHQLISVDRVETLHSDLINFQTQSAIKHATTSTGLLQILADYQARLSRVRMTLFLLTAQALFFVLYTLTIFTSSIVDRSQVELGALSGRGASPWQITGIFALENVVLALPAGLFLGPALALAITSLWGKITGQALPIKLAGEAWLLSVIAAGFGWLALVLPVYNSARRSVLGRQPERARPPQQSTFQKRNLDLYLLVFGGLFYWQLNQAGSVVMSRLGNSQLADPLLLMGPSLLVVALAMIFLRFLPYLLQLAAWFVQHLRGVALPLGVFRLARDPLQAGRVVLLVSLTAGFMLFARTFEYSLAYSQETPQSDALAQGIVGAFQLNALTLVLFSVTAFFLVHFFAVQGRAREFSVLRAMGLSARQSLTQLMVEGVVVLLMGLLAGTVVGFGLSQIMIPYLSQALAESLGSVAIERIVFDWPAVARLYLLLVAAYGSALVLLTLVLTRTRVHWTVWIGDE